MKIKTFGMCFSRDFEDTNPLSHIGPKLPVYLEFLEACRSKGWNVYVLTRKTYLGGKKFQGAWLFKNKKFVKINELIEVDLVFDWVGTLLFPPEHDPGLKVVNIRKFKDLTCNKWAAYIKLENYMPKTFWVGNIKNAQGLLDKVKTDIVVLKPYDGLRGKGIFIGPKGDLQNFTPDVSDRKYILQEFVDTSYGIQNLTNTRHDLRIVITNKKPIWCHIRTPMEGSYLANAAQGGDLKEVEYSYVPASIKKIVEVISKDFYKEYDNPIFSLDFGIDKEGTPYIFEINDQIGFPRSFHNGRKFFIESLVENFSTKI